MDERKTPLTRKGVLVRLCLVAQDAPDFVSREQHEHACADDEAHRRHPGGRAAGGGLLAGSDLLGDEVIQIPEDRR